MLTPKRGVAGRIEGFARIDIGDENTEAEVSPSPLINPEDLMQRFLQIARDLDPDYLSTIEQKIDEHINETGSVHGFNELTIADSSLDDLIGEILPGVPPLTPPSYTFFFEPEEAYKGLTYVNPSTRIYITNRQGTLVTAPASGIPVDYGIDGTPLVPIFPERIQRWIRSQANHANNTNGNANTQRIQGLNATFGTANTGANAILTPKDTTTASNEALHVLSAAGDNPHGVTIERIETYVQNEVSTFSFFLFRGTKRYITLEIEDDGGTTLYSGKTVIDLDNNEIHTQVRDVIVHLHPHPSGWYRIGVTFEHKGTTGDVSFLKVYAHDAPETLSFTGTQGERLFSLFGLNLTRGEGLAPYVETVGSSITLSATSITFNISSHLSTTEGMLFLSWYGSLNGKKTSGNEFGGNLLKLNDATEIFKLTATGVKTTVSSTDILTEATYESNMHLAHAISWKDNNPVLSRTTGNILKENNSGITISGTLTTTTIGPAPGYLRSFAHYARYGSALNLNYLLGERTPETES